MRIFCYSENILRASLFFFVLIKTFHFQRIFPLLTVKFVHFRRFLGTKFWVYLRKGFQLIEIIHSFYAQNYDIGFAKRLSITF
jgi:hypothetical protein